MARRAFLKSSEVADVLFGVGVQAGGTIPNVVIDRSDLLFELLYGSQLLVVRFLVEKFQSASTL
jgi:hypothetical protein